MYYICFAKSTPFIKLLYYNYVTQNHAHFCPRNAQKAPQKRCFSANKGEFFYQFIYANFCVLQLSELWFSAEQPQPHEQPLPHSPPSGQPIHRFPLRFARIIYHSAAPIIAAITNTIIKSVNVTALTPSVNSFSIEQNYLLAAPSAYSFFSFLSECMHSATTIPTMIIVAIKPPANPPPTAPVVINVPI